MCRADLQLLAGVIILMNVVTAVVLKWFFIPTYPFTIIIVTILGYGVIVMFLAKVGRAPANEQFEDWFCRNVLTEWCLATARTHQLQQLVSI